MLGEARKRTSNCRDISLLQLASRQAVDAIIAQRYAGGLAWFAANASSTWWGNSNQKKGLSIQALDAVLAQDGV